MKKTSDDQLSASDVLNWEYLVEIGQKPEGIARDLVQALAGFAYDFTSTANEDARNLLLHDLLKNGTDHQSKETADAFIKAVAYHFHSDLQTLRRFAKQIGVRLPRGVL